jgi:hypothetical protein
LITECDYSRVVVIAKKRESFYEIGSALIFY